MPRCKVTLVRRIASSPLLHLPDNSCALDQTGIALNQPRFRNLCLRTSTLLAVPGPSSLNVVLTKRSLQPCKSHWRGREVGNRQLLSQLCLYILQQFNYRYLQLPPLSVARERTQPGMAVFIVYSRFSPPSEPHRRHLSPSHNPQALSADEHRKCTSAYSHQRYGPLQRTGESWGAPLYS